MAVTPGSRPRVQGAGSVPTLTQPATPCLTRTEFGRRRISHHPRVLLLFSIAVLATGCTQPGIVVTSTRVDLGPRWLRLTPQEPLEAPGPRNELCLHIPKTYSLESTTSFPPNVHGVRAPDGTWIMVRAVMITPTGRRDELPQNGYTFSGWQAICFGTRSAVDPHRAYAGVELWASRHLAVDAVTWDSGERRPFL